MLEDGVILRSTSEWAAPVVLITKKNGKIHFCMDYRWLNSISRTDSYPMLRVDELIDRLGSANYISTLDLSRGILASFHVSTVKSEDCFRHLIRTV